jgi:hypothetical protein
MSNTNGNGNGGNGWTGFVMPAMDEPAGPVEIEDQPVPPADVMAAMLAEGGQPGATVSGAMVVDGPPCITFIVNIPDDVLTGIVQALQMDADELPIRSTMVALPVPNLPHVFLVVVAVEFRGHGLYIMPFDISRSAQTRHLPAVRAALEEQPLFAMVSGEGVYVAIAFPEDMEDEVLKAVEAQLDRFDQQPWTTEEFNDAVIGFDQLLSMLDITDVVELAELVDRMHAEMPS